jgi:DNA modification methylase
MLDYGFYNMDCMDGMKQFPDKYFDLAIVDPPYGDGGGQWKRQDKSRFGGVFDRYRRPPSEVHAQERERENSKRYSNGRNMGEQVWQKNYFVGHSPETGIF